MNAVGLIAWLIVGAIAGWFAGILIKGSGFGLLGDLAIGIIGAFIGGWLANGLGISIERGLIGSLLFATAGALVLIFFVGLIKRA